MTIGANLPYIIDRVPKTVTPLHGVRQMDIIKGVFVLPTPVIYRLGTKIVRANKFQNIAKKLCFYLVDYSKNAIFAMS